MEGEREGKLRKIGREGKSEIFRGRYVRRSEKGGGRPGGRGRQGGGERPTPCLPVANKNQIHQEYSGLRKGIHL